MAAPVEKILGICPRGTPFKFSKAPRPTAIQAIPAKVLGLKSPRLQTHLPTGICTQIAKSGLAITRQTRRRGIIPVVDFGTSVLLQRVANTCKSLLHANLTSMVADEYV